MEVIFFQLAIVATIWIAHRINPDYALWAAIAWSVETLLLLFYPPLIVIQLGVIWGTYSLLQKFSRQKDIIAELESRLTGHPTNTIERLKSLPPDAIIPISGRKHHEYLQNAINECTKHLAILSGWISDKVIDRRFIEGIRSALRRGANVYLGYGWEDSAGKHSEPPSSRRAVARLRKLQKEARVKKYPGQLVIGKFANHEKILVKDSDYAICGSNNWLSNSRFRNRERSLLVKLPDFAAEEARRVVRLVLNHAEEP